jgi:hypothetical protein
MRRSPNLESSDRFDAEPITNRASGITSELTQTDHLQTEELFIKTAVGSFLD